MLLERHHADLVAQQPVDALDGGAHGLHGGQAGHRAGDGGGADLVAVEAAAGAVRRVDDEVDLAVVDQLDDGPLAVRALALAVLAHQRGRDAAALEDLGGAGGGEHLEAQADQRAGREDQVALVAVGDRDEDLALGRQRAVGAGLGLRVGGAEHPVQAHDLAGGAHLRAEDGVHAAAVDVAEAAPRHHGLLDRDRGVGRQGAAVALGREHALGAQLGDGGAERDPGGGLGQRHRGRLGGERHGARGARVGLQDVQDVAGERELDVDQTAHPDAAGDGLGGGAQPLDVVPAEGDRRQGAGGVAGVDAGLLDVLHDAAEVELGAVVEGVDVDLHRVVEEAVDQHRVLGDQTGVPLQVGGERLLVVDDLHAASAEHVGRAGEHRVADLVGEGLGLGEGEGGAVLGGGQARVAQDAAESAALLGQVDGLRLGADDRHAVVLERLGQAERGLAAELDDHTGERSGLLLGVDDLQHVLQGERLEVEPVGGVVVGGDGLRVAVDHDGLVPGLGEREGGVHAGVVELDALADAVRAGAEDDHRGLGARGDLVLLVVGRVEVRGLGRELGRAGVDGLEDRADAQRVPDLADHVGAQAADLADLVVGEAVPLGVAQQLGGELGGLGQLAGDLVEQEELVDEPRVDLGELEHLVRGGPGPDGLHHGVDPAVGRHDRLGQQLGLVAHRADPGELGALLLQRAQRLLQRLGEVAAHGHRLAHRLHGGGEGGVGARELLEREPGHLDHDVVEGRLEGGRGLLGDVVGDLVEGVADGQLGGDLGDREAGRLGGQRRGAGHPRVHLDDDDPAVVGVDGELDVAAAGVDADLADHGDADVAQDLVLAVGERHRRGDGDRVTGVHAHRVEVLDRADDHDVVVLVAHQLELVLLPAEDGLLQEHLGGRGERQALAGDAAQLVLVVGEAGAGAAHGEGGADDDRVAAEGVDPGDDLVHGVADDRAGGLAVADLGVDGLDHALEQLAVLALVDRLDVGADQLDAVLLQRAGAVQGDRGVERGLAAQGGQQGVGALLGDDLLDELRGDRLDVGGVGDLRVGHDRRRVGVHQDDPQALGLQDATRLRARVVELGGLADHDRAGPDDQDGLDVSALRHAGPP